MRCNRLVTGSVKWLILVASIFVSQSAFSNDLGLICGLNEYKSINKRILAADLVSQVESIAAECGMGKGSFSFELKRRVYDLYISGADSLLMKYKVSSGVNLYLVTSDESYLLELVTQFVESENLFVELCVFNLWNNKHCDESSLDSLIKKNVPHAIWAKSQFYIEDQPRRLNFLHLASNFGHVDANSELLLATIGDIPLDNDLNKRKLLSLAKSGKSIDAEISYLRMNAFGLSPYESDPETVIVFIQELLKYRSYSELYYFLAIAYFDKGEEYLPYLETAVEMGNKEAIDFLGK